MLALIGLGAASRQTDLLAALDRRQSDVSLPPGVTSCDYALQQARSTAGVMSQRTIRCGPADAADCLAGLLQTWPEADETITILEQSGDGAVVLIFARPRSDVAAFAHIGPPSAEHYQAAELVQLGGPDQLIRGHLAAGTSPAVVTIVNGLPTLAGLAQLAVCVHGRRIPGNTSPYCRPDSPDDSVWPRFWPPRRGGGQRTGIAVLPDGSSLAVVQPARPIADRIAGADVAPRAFRFAAADPAELAERIGTLDGATSPDTNGPGGDRAVLLADSASERDRAARALLDKLDDPFPPAQFVDPGSGSLFVTEPLGAAPVALVFSGFGSGHPGMMRRLTDALPPLADYLESTFGDDLGRLMPTATLYPPSAENPNATQPLQGDPAAIAGAEVLAPVVYGWLARELLGLRPAAAIGVSLGALAMAPVLCGEPETIAPVLCGANGLLDCAENLVGDAGEAADEDQWAHAWVGGPADDLLAALQGFPTLHLLVRCHARLLLLGGKNSEIRRFLQAHHAVGRMTSSGMRYLHTKMIGAAVERVENALSTATVALPRRHLRGIDFYVSDRPVRAGASTEAMGQWCRQVRDSLVVPVDLPAIIRAAYRRGIRVFVVCSPRDDMIDWIDRILDGLPHLAVPLGCSRMDPWRALLSGAYLLRAHGALADETPLDQIMRIPA